MTTVEIFGQSTRNADAIFADTSRLVNLYREPIVGGGRAQYLLKSVLGMAEFCAPDGIYCRALGVVDEKLYASVGDALLTISAGGSHSTIATIDGSGNTTIGGNNGNVTVVSGGDYYLWDGDVITNPTAGAFSLFGSHCYIGNYTVLTELNGRRFQWSDLADASSLPGLNFSTADGQDDNLIRPFEINGTLYLFKERSHEIWYLTGSAGAEAFARQSGGVYSTGLMAHNLIAALPQSAFFVGSDGRAYVVAGGVQPVSTPSVEVAIRDSSPIACVSYDDDGHTFCAIVFRDCPAWVYDVATGEWHERAYGQSMAPWPVTCSVKFRGDWYVGMPNANIAKLDRSYADNGSVLIREATGKTIYQDGQRFKISDFEVYPRQGFQDGTIELHVSRDGGATWSDPKPRQVGSVGKFATKVNWRNLGLSRQFTMKVRFSEASAFSMLCNASVK